LYYTDVKTSELLGIKIIVIVHVCLPIGISCQIGYNIGYLKTNKHPRFKCNLLYLVYYSILSYYLQANVNNSAGKALRKSIKNRAICMIVWLIKLIKSTTMILLCCLYFFAAYWWTSKRWTYRACCLLFSSTTLYYPYCTLTPCSYQNTRNYLLTLKSFLSE